MKPFFATINDRGSLTLPAPIREQLQIEPGTLLRLSVTSDDKLLIEVGEFSARTSSEGANAKKPSFSTLEKEENLDTEDDESEEEVPGQPRPELLEVCESYKRNPVKGCELRKVTQERANLSPPRWGTFARFQFSFVDSPSPTRHASLIVSKKLLKACPWLLTQLETWANEREKNQMDWRPALGTEKRAIFRWLLDEKTSQEDLLKELRKLIALTAEKVGSAIDDAKKARKNVEGATNTNP